MEQAAIDGRHWMLFIPLEIGTGSKQQIVSPVIRKHWTALFEAPNREGAVRKQKNTKNGTSTEIDSHHRILFSPSNKQGK